MRFVLAIILVTTMAACSGSGSSGSAGSMANLNPFNWFGNGGTPDNAERPASLLPARALVQFIDTRPLINQITALVAENTASGVIFRATGLAPSEGYHSADLVAVASVKANELVFEFRARPPENVARIGPTRLRELVAGVHLTHAQLIGIRIVRVVAGRNSRSVRP